MSKSLTAIFSRTVGSFCHRTLNSITVAISIVAFSSSFIGLTATAEEKPKESTEAKITYSNHVLPIFRQHCLACHSADSSKGDLSLDSYAATMEGGASGDSVVAGDLDESWLWLLVTHQEKPLMPPKADKLSKDKLDILQKWIEGGLLENSGSVAKVNKKPGLAMISSGGSQKPEGPPPMPEHLFREPIVHTNRAAAVPSVATSPWAPLAAVPGQRQIPLYHTDSGKLLGVLPFLEGTPQVLRFSRNGKILLAAGGRGAAKGVADLYEVQTGSKLVSVGDELDAVHAADLHPNLSLVATGGPKRIVRVYTISDGEIAFTIRKHTDWITAISFSPDGKWLITADRSAGAFIWEAETGQEIASLRGHKGAITAADWRADSKIVATSSADGTIRFWNPEEGNSIKSWNAHGGGVTNVRFAKDGRVVSTGRDKRVKVWKADGGHLKDVATFADIALAAQFTHDDKRIVAGDFSGNVRLLDATSGQHIGNLSPNPPTLKMRETLAVQTVSRATALQTKAEADMQVAQKNMAAVKEKAKQLASAVTETKKKKIAAQANVQTAQKNQEAMKQALQATRAKSKQATTLLLNASKAVQTAEAALAKAEKENKEAPAAKQAFAASTQKAKEAVEALQASQKTTNEAEKKLRAADQKLLAMNKALAGTTKQVQQAEAAVQNYAQTMTIATDSLSAQQAKLTQETKKVEQANHLVAAIKQEEAAFAVAAQTMEQRIATRNKEAESAGKLLESLSAKTDVAKQTLTARKQKLAEEAKKLAAMQAEVKKQEAATREAEKQLAEAQQAAQAKQQEQQKAAAQAAQAESDKELFQKAEELRKALKKE